MKILEKLTVKKENMVVVALIGVLLLVIAIPTKPNSDSQQEKSIQTKNIEKQEEIDSDSDYISALEVRMEDFLSNMEGVGKVKVMITLKTSQEVIVEKDIPTTRNSIIESDAAGGSRSTNDMQSQETTVYTINEAGDKIPYVIKTKEPEIEGITVAAQGGGNATVQKNISEVIQALFQIEVHKIRVVKMR